MSELERIFKENGGYFAEFEIQKFFEKVKTNPLPYKAQDLKDKNDEIYSLPALTAWVLNQWLAYNVPREWATILKNVISVSANGANTGVMFYQPKEFTVLQDSYAIRFKWKILSDLEYLYLLTTLQKSIRFRFDWSNKAGWERIKTEPIILPLDKTWNIAFDYMENYIRFLEAERIEELEAYLLATGLKDYDLNDREKSALEKFENSQNPAGGGYNIKKFCLKDIFDINPTKYYKFKNDEIIFKNWKIPLVSNSSTDNWIMWFSNLEPLNKWNTITCSDTTVWADTMFYQKDDFIGYSHIQHFVPKNILKNFSKKIALYIIPLIRKSTENKYDYWIKFNREAMNKTEISLPILWENIDLEFMENFIKAVEKLVIKDLVIWNEKKLSAYRQVIQK